MRSDVNYADFLCRTHGRLGFNLMSCYSYPLLVRIRLISSTYWPRQLTNFLQTQRLMKLIATLFDATERKSLYVTSLTTCPHDNACGMQEAFFLSLVFWALFSLPRIALRHRFPPGTGNSPLCTQRNKLAVGSQLVEPPDRLLPRRTGRTPSEGSLQSLPASF